jgi:hypothetical protein
MSYPKWKYRKHPTLGVFQSTLVASEDAEIELGTEWNEDPQVTGFKVRPANHVHVSHIVDGLPLHELATDAAGSPVIADIAITTTGDTLNA